MRIVQNPQMQLGQVNIAEIKFDPKSRDDTPKVLIGLQYIYTNLEVRKEVFALLEEDLLKKINKNNGRPGMDLWKILVLGVLRLNLNIDYDRLHDLSNFHSQIRQMLGHADIFDTYYYNLQTLKDNIQLLTPELLDKINQIVVKTGHDLLKKKEENPLHGRVDSFVFETNVHYPTDINLLFDAMRKSISLIFELSAKYNLSIWRQAKNNISKIKKLMRNAQNKKKSRSKDEEVRKKQEKLCQEAHEKLIDVSAEMLIRVQETLGTLRSEDFSLDLKDELLAAEIETYVKHGERQINQIRRRVIEGEIIPHDEKVFSIFEPHTEWISKGKAGVPVELGLKVCILEDQYRFILHHKIMKKQADVDVCLEMIKETKKRFPNLESSSFDRGFYSKENRSLLQGILNLFILPKKGKLSKADKEDENTEEFKKGRRKHSGIESAINALEVHGLDVCPDRGFPAFERYVALAVLSRNIQNLGNIIMIQRQKEALKKQRFLERKRLKNLKPPPIQKAA